MIVDQDQPDDDEADRPQPCKPFTRANGFRKAKLQPARPSGDDSKNGKWCVAELNKKLLLHVAQWVSVCKQQYATKRAHRREDQSRKVRLQAVGFHAPLKNRKQDDKQDSDAMLENIREHETFPEAVRTQWPVLGIGTKEQKQGQSQKDKRPHLRPSEIFASREQCENS